MKETGLMFRPEMVRAILENRKTRTSRPLKPQPVLANGVWTWKGTAWDEAGAILSERFPVDLCPYGGPGDLLYVKETWARIEFGFQPEIVYRADEPNLAMAKNAFNGWKSSMFMPKAVARVWLEITGVRVQRIQEISPRDIIEEGIRQRVDLHPRDAMYVEKKAFVQLWDTINEKKGFAFHTNPWVWVISFNRELAMG